MKKFFLYLRKFYHRFFPMKKPDLELPWTKEEMEEQMKYNRIVLSEQAYDKLIEMINNPPQPCERLKKLLTGEIHYEDVAKRKKGR